MYYLAGIVDITVADKGWGMIKPDFCMPAGVTLNQVRKVAIKGLNERPERLHLSAASQINDTFRDAFPCD